MHQHPGRWMYRGKLQYLTIKSEWAPCMICFSERMCSCCLVSTMWRFFSIFIAKVFDSSLFNWTLRRHKTFNELQTKGIITPPNNQNQKLLHEDRSEYQSFILASRARNQSSPKCKWQNSWENKQHFKCLVSNWKSCYGCPLQLLPPFLPSSDHLLMCLIRSSRRTFCNGVMQWYHLFW